VALGPSQHTSHELDTTGRERHGGGSQVRKVFLVACAATALVLPVVAVTGQAGSTPARAPAPAGPAGPVVPAERAEPTAAPVVSPRLTDVPLGSAGLAAGRQVSTGEPDAPVVRVAARELTVRRPVTARFSAVGVTWAANQAVGEVRVELRHRLGRGRWSGWSTIEPGDADAADAAARPGSRGGTDAVWTGPSTGVEARVAPISGAPPSDVRLTLVDPGGSAADATPTPTPTAGTLAAVARPKIYPRAQWGADPRLMGWTPEYSRSLKAGFLHHTAGTNSYTSTQVPAILRSIYAFHSRTRGWGDIGYNFLVDRFGRVWEGRYGGMDSTVVGAHAGGFNADTFGVSMLGTYETTAVPAATVNAVSAVFAWKLARWNLDPYGTARLTSSGGGTSRYRAGTAVTKNVVSGHRDVGNTSCPGSRGFAALPTIRRQAAARIAAGGGAGGGGVGGPPAPPPPPAGPPRLTSPAVSPGSVPYAATAGPRITAGVTGSGSWSVAVTRDCGGAVVRRWSGSGARVDLRWDLRDGGGSRVRPGAYTVVVSPTATAGGTGSYSARVTVQPPTGTAPIATGPLPAPGPARYVPVTPVRVLDTREVVGGGDRMPLGGGRRLDVPVLGVGGLPASGVSAVVVSTAATCANADTPVTLWPAGSRAPVASQLSVSAAVGTAAALATVRLGAGGRISVTAGRGSPDVILDVVGYLPLAGGAGYHPVAASRIVDAVLEAGETRVVRGPVPAGAVAMMVNVAVVRPGAPGAVRLWPAGQDRPRIADLRYVAGTDASDRAVVRLDPRGETSMHNESVQPVRVVLDLSGWFGGTGQRFTAVTPTRLPAVRLPAATDVTVPVGAVPAGSTVVASLSLRSSARTWAVAWSRGSRPATADLHAGPGRWETSLLTLPVAADGRIRLRSSAGSAQAVLDVVGYHR